jgi:hypothetical protein
VLRSEEKLASYAAADFTVAEMIVVDRDGLSTCCRPSHQSRLTAAWQRNGRIRRL